MCFLTEPSVSAPCGAEGVRANMHVRCVRAHVYAQTVHTLASHEMFISCVDVQTCMARKTPSFHVHRMGVAQWVQGAWALPPSLRDLEQAPPPWPQSLLCTGTGGWALPTLTRLHFLHSAPRKVHGHSAGRGWCAVGSALPTQNAGPGCCWLSLQALDREALAGLPITLSLQAFGRGS